MSNLTTSIPLFDRWVSPIFGLLRQTDKAWLVMAAIVVGIALFNPPILFPTLQEALGNLTHTAVFIAFAVLLIAWLRATGAEALVGKAFQGHELKMVLVAAVVGGIAPFCSCEVVPFIAAMLAMGTPLSAVMAFWLSSPIMDPPMFAITAGALGFEFALGKTIAAVGFGLFGGFSMMVLTRTSLFVDPLKQTVVAGCGSGCSSDDPYNGKIRWSFWQEASRLNIFVQAATSNALFLLKWLALAYLLESLMIRYIPAEWVASVLGGDGLQPIALGALLGGPAYLNGYAAVPLVQGLLEQGMSQGAAMSFVLAGSVTCVPAAVAVWALVKPRVFIAYITLGLIAAFIAGLLWSQYSSGA